MKTPREILLQHHESARDSLDAVRKNALSAAFPQPEPGVQSRSLPSTLYHQLSTLFRLKPQAWAGLAALWILIFALKFSTHETMRVAVAKSSVSPEAVAELKRQKQFFAELAGLRESRDDGPPKPLPFRPRSERRHLAMPA